MKRVVFASVGLLALSVTQISAADLAARPYTKALPPVAAQPVYSWTGFYVGINGGYGVGRDSSSQLALSGPGFEFLDIGTPLYGGPQNFNVATQGALGGAQIGYNWQTSANFVLGLEADIQASDIKGGTGCIVTCGTGVIAAPFFPVSLFPVLFSDNSVQHKIDWFGTVRARAGFTTGPSLFYVTGGLAYGDVKRSANVVVTTINPFSFIYGPPTFNDFAGSYSATTLKTGWTIGAGLESKIWNNWSIKAEYLYVDLGSTTDTFNTVFTSPGPNEVGSIAATRTETSRNRDHIFRLGLNYGFSPAAVVARY